MHFNTTHGMSHSPTYRSWSGMLTRCRNPNCPAYTSHGGRGIKVCSRWLKFESFYADMGLKPKGRTLDRYPNNNGDYAPGNCRWATPKEQANNRRDNKILELDGVKKPLHEWSEITGFSRQLIQHRLKRQKLSVKEALTIPVGKTGWEYPNQRMLTYQGRTQTLSKWSHELGIKKDTLIKRQVKGWSVEQILKIENYNV